MMHSKPSPKFPGSKVESDRLEESFASEIEQLSLRQHEQIMFDVHGFGHNDDDPPSLDDKFVELEREVGLVKEKYAYERAKYLNQAYVEHKSFRLQFLRSQRFNVKHAADLLVFHFERKLHLFGDGDILGRDIRLSDLSGDSLRAMENGCVQMLPARDVAGRVVECISPEWKEDASAESVARAMWYYYMVCLQDEDLQKNGYISVFYNYGKYKQGPSFSEKLRHNLLGIPGKLVGVHYCTCDTNMMPFLAGVRHFMEGDERFRLRSHVGDPRSVHFELQTFGIQTKDSPMQPDGSWSIKEHREWLEIQRQREDKSIAMSNTIILPRRYDVLFGRSKKCREHSGNVHLVHLCSLRSEEYDEADKPSKTRISDNLLCSVRDSGGRFLKWEGSSWVEVNDSVAREKISHFFRHMRSNKVTPATQEPKTSGKRRAIGETVA